MAVKLTFYVPKAKTLKSKKKACKNLISKTLRRFNASITETDIQELRQTLSISAAVISSEIDNARRILRDIIRYMEKHTRMKLVIVEYK